MAISLSVNGRVRDIKSDPETPFVYVLRDELKLKGSKLGCGLEQCGACAVLADGELTLTCVTPVAAFEGKEVVTIEGIGESEVGRRVQDAFVELSAAQCGYCTAGLVVAVTALLSRSEAPKRDDVVEALTPQLCRCGSHPRVLRAVEELARS